MGQQPHELQRIAEPVIAADEHASAGQRLAVPDELLMPGQMAADLAAAGAPPFTLTIGDRVVQASTLREGVEHIVRDGRKGLEIQRYKGLGEMNPGQLWETTMDPTTRTLLQVKVDDAVEADIIFSTLMGDEVEPRRKFIEENALSVRNLDV